MKIVLIWLLATIVKFTLPSKLDDGNCIPGTQTLQSLDSVKVLYHVYGSHDTLVAFSAYVIRMEGDTLSVSIPSDIQTDVWVRTHNSIGWSCPAYLLLNPNVSVPHYPKLNLRVGKVYDVTGGVGDTTKTGVYFLVQPNRTIRRVIVKTGR